MLGQLLGLAQGANTGIYSIRGTQILRDGEPVRFAGGVNAMHTYSLGSEADYLRLKEWNVGIVREFISNLYETPLTGEYAKKSSNGEWLWPMQSFVDDNRANGFVTILCPFYWVNQTTLEVTVFSGKYPAEQGFYNAYKDRMRVIAEHFKNQSDVWVQVWNEPYPWDNSNGYKNETWLRDHIDMVDNLRSVSGFDNIIIVQGNGQGQLEEALLSRGADLLADRPNILFSLHGYEKWMMGSDATVDAIVARLLALKAAGFALIFGECGVINSSGLMPGFLNFLEGMTLGDIPTLAWLWKYNDNDKNSLMNSSGLPNNNGNLNWGSEYKKFLANKALSTSFPTAIPSQLPHQVVPSAMPTFQTPSPTTSDTFTVDLTLEMVTSKASVSASETKALRSTIASTIGLEIEQIQNLVVTVTAYSRRRLLSSYAWTISFDVVATLESVSASSTEVFVESMKSSFESSTFASDVSAAVNTPVTITSVSAVIKTRHPSPSPTSLSPSENAYDKFLKGNAEAIIVIAAAFVGVMLSVVAVVVFRRGRKLEAANEPNSSAEGDGSPASANVTYAEQIPHQDSPSKSGKAAPEYTLIELRRMKEAAHQSNRSEKSRETMSVVL